MHADGVVAILDENCLILTQGFHTWTQREYFPAVFVIASVISKKLLIICVPKRFFWKFLFLQELCQQIIGFGKFVAAFLIQILSFL